MAFLEKKFIVTFTREEDSELDLENVASITLTEDAKLQLVDRDGHTWETQAADLLFLLDTVEQTRVVGIKASISLLSMLSMGAKK